MRSAISRHTPPALQVVSVLSGQPEQPSTNQAQQTLPPFPMRASADAPRRANAARASLLAVGTAAAMVGLIGSATWTSASGAEATGAASVLQDQLAKTLRDSGVTHRDPAQAMPSKPITMERLRQDLDQLLRDAAAIKVEGDASRDIDNRYVMLKQVAIQLAEQGHLQAVGVFNAAVIELDARQIANPRRPGEYERYTNQWRMILREKTSVADRIVIADAQIAALERALPILESSQYPGGYAPAPSSVAAELRIVRKELEQVRKMNPNASGLSAALTRFDGVLARAEGLRLTRVYAPNFTGTFALEDLPAPFTPRPPAATSDLDVDAVRSALVNNLKTAQEIRIGPRELGATFEVVMLGLRDTIHAAAKTDSGAVALIGDYNATLIGMKQLTYTIRGKELGFIRTPGRIGLTGVNPALQPALLAREVDALRDALKPDYPDEMTYQMLLRQMGHVHDDLEKIAGSCKCDKLVADYNALVAQAATAVGRRMISGFPPRYVAADIPATITRSRK